MRLVLIVEDNVDAAAVLRTGLEEHGYSVIDANSAATGMRLFELEAPDLVILDMNLPDGRGSEVCRDIRGHKLRGRTPVIMLTGEAGLAEKERAFSAGADQYLTKPIRLGELLLWMQALFRRSGAGPESAEQRAGDLRIDAEARLAFFKGQPLTSLTAREFDLLRGLVERRPRVLSRKFILSNLWRTVGVDRLVDAHLGNLRKKLPAELAGKIQSVSGKGFRFLG